MNQQLHATLNVKYLVHVVLALVARFILCDSATVLCEQILFN